MNYEIHISVRKRYGGQTREYEYESGYLSAAGALDDLKAQLDTIQAEVARWEKVPEDIQNVAEYLRRKNTTDSGHSHGTAINVSEQSGDPMTTPPIGLKLRQF